MNAKLIPITNLDFNKSVTIRFKNLLSGLDNFSNFILDGNTIEDAEETFISFITDVFHKNNNECYIDFYLNNLTHNEKLNLINSLSQNDKEILLNQLEINHDTPYYKLTTDLLIPFLVRLNTRELFFITFYFTNKPVTIWGNYNLNFPCFFNNNDDYNYYLNLATSFDINIKV